MTENYSNFACSNPSRKLREIYIIRFTRRSKNMLRLISYFYGLVYFMKRYLSATFSKQLKLFHLCYRHAFLFLFIIMIEFPVICVFHVFSKFNSSKEDMIHWRIFCNSTCRSVLLSCVKRVFNYHEFHLGNDTIGTWLQRVENGGHEKLENEMWRFTNDTR